MEVEKLTEQLKTAKMAELQEQQLQKFEDGIKILKEAKSKK